MMKTPALVRRSSHLCLAARAIACVCVIALTACAPQRIAGTGTRVEPPQGWVEYCKRHPEDKACS